MLTRCGWHSFLKRHHPTNGIDENSFNKNSLDEFANAAEFKICKYSNKCDAAYSTSISRDGEWSMQRLGFCILRRFFEGQMRFHGL